MQRGDRREGYGRRPELDGATAGQVHLVAVAALVQRAGREPGHAEQGEGHSAPAVRPAQPAGQRQGDARHAEGGAEPLPPG